MFQFLLITQNDSHIIANIIHANRYTTNQKYRQSNTYQGRRCSGLLQKAKERLAWKNRSKQ